MSDHEQKLSIFTKRHKKYKFYKNLIRSDFNQKNVTIIKRSEFNDHLFRSSHIVIVFKKNCDNTNDVLGYILFICMEDIDYLKVLFIHTQYDPVFNFMFDEFHKFALKRNIKNIQILLNDSLHVKPLERFGYCKSNVQLYKNTLLMIKTISNISDDGDSNKFITHPMMRPKFHTSDDYNGQSSYKDTEEDNYVDYIFLAIMIFIIVSLFD